MAVSFSRDRFTFAAIGLLMIVLVATGTIMGQSGKNVIRRPQPASTPDPEPVEPIKPAQPKEKPKPSFIIDVVADTSLGVYSMYARPESMQAWTVHRLRTSILLDIHDSGKGSRGDAIKIAKGGSDIYVLWMQIRESSYSGSPSMSGSLQDVSVYFELFSPTTGKTKTAGTIPLNALNRTAAPVSTIGRSCHQGVYGNEYYVLQASLEAAERVMSTLNIPIPADCTQPIPGT